MRACATPSITGLVPAFRTTRTVVPITTACGTRGMDMPVLCEASRIARLGLSSRCSRAAHSTTPNGAGRLPLDKWWGVHLPLAGVLGQALAADRRQVDVAAGIDPEAVA